MVGATMHGTNSRDSVIHLIGKKPQAAPTSHRCTSMQLSYRLHQPLSLRQQPLRSESGRLHRRCGHRERVLCHRSGWTSHYAVIEPPAAPATHVIDRLYQPIDCIACCFCRLHQPIILHAFYKACCSYMACMQCSNVLWARPPDFSRSHGATSPSDLRPMR